MNSIHPIAPAGRMTSQQRADQIEALCDAWAEAEAAYEAFLGRYEQIDVQMMPEAEFTAWRADYSRLYSQIWIAQVAYYQAIRG